MNNEKEKVQEFIEKYLFYYPNEKQKLNQIQDFVLNGSDILKRSNTVGHFTASGYIYIRKKKKRYYY